jgi:hypothetical protein
MGFLDALLGKRKLQPQAAKNTLFAMSTAYVGLEAQQNIRTRGAAAIVFQPLATGDFATIVEEMEEVLRGTGEETDSTIDSTDDSFGYRWMVIRDPDIEDLVVGVNAVNDALEVGGYGERVLCAVFAFEEAGGKPLYFIYNVKRGLWYPFVPAGGEQQRNSERELQIKAAVGPELPFEPELERWFPLWGIPI